MKEPIRPCEPYKWEYEAQVERKYISVKDISKVNLAWLIEQIPEGLSPADIKIEFGFEASSFAIENHYVGFYYVERVPARRAEFKADMAKYEENLKKYEETLQHTKNIANRKK